MQEFLPILRECPLFLGLQEDELLSMLQCLDGRIQSVEKGITVFREGDTARWVGVVLSGAVQVLREDYFGNRSVLSVLEEGELFGEVFACAEIEELPVSVCTIKESKILLLDCQRVLTTCSNACRFHSRLIRNLLQAVARKNLQLNQKISIMSKRTTREKLMAYLLEQAKQYGSREFRISMDRQALADYLGVERSAMSAELGKLRKSGVLDCKGSWFRLEKNMEESGSLL